MSDDLDQILPGLYLGSCFAAESIDILEEKHITHILTVGCGMDPVFPDKFIYKVFEIDDYEEEDIKKYFDEGIQFIDTPTFTI